METFSQLASGIGIAGLVIAGLPGTLFLLVQALDDATGSRVFVVDPADGRVASASATPAAPVANLQD